MASSVAIAKPAAALDDAGMTTRSRALGAAVLWIGTAACGDDGASGPPGAAASGSGGAGGTTATSTSAAAGGAGGDGGTTGTSTATGGGGSPDSTSAGGGGSGGAGSTSTGSGGEGGGDPCEALGDDPLVAPSGFTMHEKTWEQAFYGYRYPLSGGPLAPIGSFTLRDEFPPTGPPIAGRYITIPFTPDGGNHKLEWALAQPIGAHGYPGRGASTIWVGVSTCKGDFRPADEAAGEPLLRDACRKFSIQSALFYGPTESSNVCELETGATYYLNVIFADPADGLSPTEHTCSGSEERCEGNFKHN